MGVVIVSKAQLNGQFATGQDGHIYFQAHNTTGYAFPIAITATSLDRTNSDFRNQRRCRLGWSQDT